MEFTNCSKLYFKKEKSIIEKFYSEKFYRLNDYTQKLEPHFSYLGCMPGPSVRHASIPCVTDLP